MHVGTLYVVAVLYTVLSCIWTLVEWSERSTGDLEVNAILWLMQCTSHSVMLMWWIISLHLIQLWQLLPFFLCWLICYSELNLGVFTSCPQNSSSCDECEKKRTMLGHGLSETTFSSRLWHGVVGRVVDEVWKQLCPSTHEPCPRPLRTGKGVRSFSIQLTPNLHQMCVHCFFAPVLQRDW